MQELFADWRHREAELLSVDTRKRRFDPVPVEAAATRAMEMLDIQDPGGNGYIIPLFLPGEPTPVNRYVVFRPDVGTIRWNDSGFGISGTDRAAACEKLEPTEIGQRLQYWLLDESDADLGVDESELPADRVAPASSLSASDERRFFADLKEFVRSEKQAERDSNWETYSEMGLDEAIRRNRVSGPFVALGKGESRDGTEVYRFQLVPEDDDGSDDSLENVDLRDEEGIFRGNHCIADLVGTDDAFPVAVEVTSIDGPGLAIQPDWGTVSSRGIVDSHLCSDGTELWLHRLLNPVPYDRRLKAISAVKRDDRKRELLTGKRAITSQVNRFAVPESAIELNEYQRLALIWADSADDVVCIHGPPGTGKTRTLTAYVRHAVDRGQSVLVTAHSNQAVDNLLVGDSTVAEPEEETLHAMAQDPDVELSIARQGMNSRNAVVNEYYTGNSVSGADIVATTTSGASTFDQDSFDVAVVDEATQASRPSTAIVLNCARKLVLAGDHRQLPPYCADESMQEDELHVSLFEYLLDRYGAGISVLLRTQYRMNDEIARFSNEAFYGGQLETADRNRDWTVDDLKPLMGVDVRGEERRESYGNSFYNEAEAEAVANQVKLLVQSGLAPEDIGVITAYSGQKRKVREFIDRLDIAGTGRLTVDTVDSFQGGEREAIIVSFVRSNPDGHSGFLEFPDVGPRRLNVALTRARKRLVLVGNWETLGTVAPHRTAEESCAPLYERLATHIRSQDRMLSLEQRA